MKILKSLALGLVLTSALAVPVLACNAEVGSSYEGLSAANTCSSCTACRALDSGHYTKVSRSKSAPGTYGYAALGGNTSRSAFLEVRIGGDSLNSRVTGNGYLQTQTYRRSGNHNVASAHGVN